MLIGELGMEELFYDGIKEKNGSDCGRRQVTYQMGFMKQIILPPWINSSRFFPFYISFTKNNLNCVEWKISQVLLKKLSKKRSISIIDVIALKVLGTFCKTLSVHKKLC